MQYKPYPYQQAAEKWIYDHPACGLFLEMGLGKTVVTLTAINRLIYEDMEVGRALVIAPLRVAATVWAEEAAKWDHLSRLRCVKVLGTVREREAALNQDADVYIINRENVAWLEQHFRRAEGAGGKMGRSPWPFDMVVLDELSSFKAASSERFKALRRLRPAVKRIVGLTGTPAPNGYMDLWAQIYLLDRGERLGKTLGGYRARYFTPGRRNGYAVYDWRLLPGADEAIMGRLGDLCISMAAADFLALPERLERLVRVIMPPEAQRLYEAMERDLAVSLRDTELTADSAAVACGKLLQMAGGAVYDEDRSVHRIHDAKLDALADLMEAAQGEPMLVYYGYQHELSRIMARFPQARKLATSQDVSDWNAGKIPLLLAHPDSAGHGLNLQAGGHIMVWFGLTWSLEKYQQANARLYRQGQKRPVTIYHLVTQGTIDERVMRVLDGKEERQSALIAAVKAIL